MQTVTLGMHQHRTSAAPTQIGTKVWEFRSCSDTNIPWGLVGCYNIAIGDVFDAGQVWDKTIPFSAHQEIPQG
jgi:hypothetical protein